MLQNPQVQILGTLFFALAILHTFLVGVFLKISKRFNPSSAWHVLFHLLGEIEVVFGLWAGLLFLALSLFIDPKQVLQYQDGLSFTEPIFVFCIMVVAATRPVLWLAQEAMSSISWVVARAFGLPQIQTDVAVILILGSLAGSFITEPAAMTVTALLLSRMFKAPEKKLVYALLAVLFVNVSIGGALTPYAAPPILMVASKWNWDFSFVLAQFGWKSSLAVVINSLGLVFLMSKKMAQQGQSLQSHPRSENKIPWMIVLIHHLFLAAIVVFAHHSNVVMGLFLFFIGFSFISQNHQDNLRLRESLLVAFFLGGLVVFGPFQQWWLAPVLTQMNELWLFKASVLLTAIVDNAALTYLGSQVESLSEISRYYLVAGAIAGGGLTIIANAPNAAGLGILRGKLPSGFQPVWLLIAALPPTLIAILCLGYL